ncbi:MAG: hypothetical protein V4671_20750, partial [Armatimonadota bacterium]
SLNSGLPFFEASLTPTGVVKKLCANYTKVVFPVLCGDVINGVSGGDPHTVPVHFQRICPIAYFYTLLNGLEDTYDVTVRNTPGTGGATINLTGMMDADTFGMMITGDEIGLSKNINTATAQVNVVDSSEILKIGSIDAGAFFPPGTV